jgi:CRISPR-associated exonuclease Cas4
MFNPLLIGIIIIFVGLVFLISLLRQRQRFGILKGNRIYQDSAEFPADVLVSKKLPLRGKPDYIIKQNNVFIPIEFKSGKTPRTPYQNHIMQLMAYCLLVEENFGTRPPGGYIRYKDKEFKIAYTKQAEEAVKNLVYEVLEKKKLGEELKCKHKVHN